MATLVRLGRLSLPSARRASKKSNQEMDFQRENEIACEKSLYYFLPARANPLVGKHLTSSAIAPRTLLTAIENVRRIRTSKIQLFTVAQDILGIAINAFAIHEWVGEIEFIICGFDRSIKDS